MRTYPEEIKKRFNLEGSKIIWLTHAKEGLPEELRVAQEPHPSTFLLGVERIEREDISPTSPEGLEELIFDFINTHMEGIILLEGIEYLIAENDFTTVLRFIHRLNEHILIKKYRSIIPINAVTMTERDLKLLEREMVAVF